MKIDNPSARSRPKFPIVEPDGTFRMGWLVSFPDVPLVQAKAKLNQLVKIHQKKNKLMISRKQTGQGVKTFHVYWGDYFLSTEVTYHTSKHQAQIEFQVKSHEGLWKDLMVLFFSELKKHLPNVEIKNLLHLKSQ